MLYPYFTEHRKKRDVVLRYIFVFHSTDSKVLSKLTTCKYTFMPVFPSCANTSISFRLVISSSDN